MVSKLALAKRWPDHLVGTIADGNFILVVGAGVSASCENDDGKSPPGWGALLEEMIAMFCRRGPLRDAAKQNFAAGNFLECAEILKVAAVGEGKLTDYMNFISRRVDGEGSHKFPPSAVHDSIMRLNPKIIITTNYDRILERASQSGFKVHSYDSRTVGSEIRSGSEVLIKIHGSVDASDNLVLTRSDYARIRREGGHALSVVQALLLTRPAFFVGYGFQDPDIHLLLENAVTSTDSAPTHYLLTGSGIPKYLENLYKNSYGTAVVRFDEGNFAQMALMLSLLADRVEATAS